MTRAYANAVIRLRWLIIAATLAVVALAAFGIPRLGFSTNYRVFFGKDNPQLLAFEAMQNTYTADDNVLFCLAPKDGNVFTRDTLAAVEELTHAAWQVPYSSRVDSITNFQHTYAEDDDLIVEDLVEGAASFSDADLTRVKEIATHEPLLRHRLINPEGSVTGVNVTVLLPQKHPMEIQEVTAFVRKMAADFRAAHPDIEVRLTGMVLMNNAFAEASLKDMGSLVPLMYGVVFVTMLLLLRSFLGTVITLVVIAFSILSGMGLAGWLGISLTPPSASAPTIILTLAVADSIHLLITMLHLMRTTGMDRHEAMAESLRINMQPVFLTSLTTVIGFLSMNFSDVPPFHDLGNIVSMGVAAAWLYSVTFLPAVAAVLPIRVRVRPDGHLGSMDRLAEWVIRRRRLLLWGAVPVILGLAAFIPRIDLNDQFVEYFDESIDFRTDTDFTVANLTGLYLIQYSLESGETAGINDPAYLAKVEAFADWYRHQPKVIHVNAITEVMKRLNKNMHGDDPAYYRLPEERDLAAQYLLLYEMSLPFGLDLNNQINVDKSATRMTVTFENLTSRGMRQQEARAQAWLKANVPPVMRNHGASPSLMFSHIAARNVRSMLGGTIAALVLISGVLLLALRSWKMGLVSLLPNLAPAIMGFGLWSILVGQVGMAVAVVVSMTLGIVVDDTVHFLSKYLRARREKGLDAEAAVRYAFSHVGTALWVTSVILVCGFAVLAQSAFKLNASMGLLTAIVITFALAADFLFLPPLLMAVDREPARTA